MGPPGPNGPPGFPAGRGSVFSVSGNPKTSTGSLTADKEAKDKRVAKIVARFLDELNEAKE
jgi:hypothetical protein